MSEQFNSEALHGISFYDVETGSPMRYIYPDAEHWSAGWIVRKTRGGQWETYRKATAADIAAINGAIAGAHHALVGKEQKG